jgi:hypothetical protein
MLAYPAWPDTGLRWLEAFDDIDLFHLSNILRPLKKKEPARSAIAGMLVARLHPVFCPPKVRPPKKVYEPKLPPNRARIAVEQGLILLQHKGQHANSRISRLAQEKFGLSAHECGQVLNTARLYGDRVALVAQMSRDALFTLSMPSLPAGVRRAVEQRLEAGEKVGAKEILRLRKAGGALKGRSRVG